MKSVRELIVESLQGCGLEDFQRDGPSVSDSILAALKEAGYLVVPVEPTEDMLSAMFRAGSQWGESALPERWAAALTASQQGRG